MFPQSMAQLDGVAPGQPSVFKLVLLGGGSVGKSSLALRFVKDDFKSILPTVGCKWRAGACVRGWGAGEPRLPRTWRVHAEPAALEPRALGREQMGPRGRPARDPTRRRLRLRGSGPGLAV